MPLSTSRRFGPEDHAIEQKRAELAALRKTQTERESAVEDLRTQIAAFRRKYLSQVGSPFAELADWNVRILELKAVLDPSHEATAKLEQAREEARENHSKVNPHGNGDGLGNGSEDPMFTPSSPLKTLYREVARRIHPDFCKNVDGLERRTRFMAEANRAYEANDPEALQRILDEYHEGAEAGETQGPDAELRRIQRQIVRAKAGIAAAEREWNALGNSQMGRLRRDCEVAEQEGHDLLAELAGSVQEQIRQAETRFNVLSRDVSLRENFRGAR